MPAALDSCVRQVKAQIKAGKLPKGSSAWAICISRLRKAGVIKRGQNRTWVMAKTLNDRQLQGHLSNAKGRLREAVARIRDGWNRRTIKNSHRFGDYYGYADFGKKEIGINSQKGDLLNTILHEELHRQHPNLSEKEVEKRSFEQEKKLTISKAVQLLSRFNK